MASSDQRNKLPPKIASSPRTFEVWTMYAGHRSSVGIVHIITLVASIHIPGILLGILVLSFHVRLTRCACPIWHLCRLYSYMFMIDCWNL